MIESLSERMAPLAIDAPALEIPRVARRGSTWIEPKLVGEVAFTEFTGDGVLRHPSFIALREDKVATEVGRLLGDPEARREQAARQTAALDRMGREGRDPSEIAAETVLRLIAAKWTQADPGGRTPGRGGLKNA